MKNQKLGLISVVSTGVGLVIATSCMLSLCQGASQIGTFFIVSIVIACGLNMLTAASLAELNALMPALTGGLAQYTLAGLGPFVTLVSMVGGYLICNSLTAPVEGTMFAFAMQEITGLPVPAPVFSVSLTVLLIIANLLGVDMFAKVQNVVAVLLIGSMILLGIIGVLGMGTGKEVVQPFTANDSDLLDGITMSAAAFWLFIGVEFIIPISKDVKNAKRNIPLGMFLSLGIICVIQIVLVLGIHHYVSWDALRESSSPHILYGLHLLGGFGKVWIGIVAVLAAVSTQNSVINSIPKICYGMSKMNMLPEIFQKTNRHGAPSAGILIYGTVIIFIEGSGLASTDGVSFLILTASVFWMVSYIISHVNVLVLRRRMPKAPRNFKIPFGPVLPLIGIAGTAYMIFHISSDPDQRMQIWMVTGGIFLFLAFYAAVWIRKRMKLPMFRAVSLEQVMAMEHPLYYKLRKKQREQRP